MARPPDYRTQSFPHSCMSQQTLQRLGVRQVEHEERLKNVETYNKKQNGTLDRVERKLDNLIYGVMITFVTFVLSILGYALIGG